MEGLIGSGLGAIGRSRLRKAVPCKSEPWGLVSDDGDDEKAVDVMLLMLGLLWLLWLL